MMLEALEALSASQRPLAATTELSKHGNCCERRSDWVSKEFEMSTNKDDLNKEDARLVEQLKRECGTENFIGWSIRDCLDNSASKDTMEKILEIRKKVDLIEREEAYNRILGKS